MMSIYRIIKGGTSFMLSLTETQVENFLRMGFEIKLLGRINI